MDRETFYADCRQHFDNLDVAPDKAVELFAVLEEIAGTRFMFDMKWDARTAKA